MPAESCLKWARRRSGNYFLKTLLDETRGNVTQDTLSLDETMSSSLFANPNQRTTRRPWPGYFLVVVSYILMLAELPLLLVTLILFMLNQALLAWPLLLFLLGMYFLLFRVFRSGKRLLIRSAEETIARDPRPYVLYLRAFNADVPASSIPEHGEFDSRFWWRFSVLTAFKFISPRLLFAPPLTEEEQIVRAFKDTGPVIAVGPPGETKPPLGAARAYIPSEEWQTHVSELVRNAGTVVIRISEESHVAPQSMLGMGSGSGLTQGLQWEVANVAREVPADRLLFLIAASDEAYGQFWSLVHGAFPRGLPPHCDSKHRRGRVRGMIGFGADWEPRLFPMSRSITSPFRLTRYPVTTAIRERLRAVRDGGQPRSPRLSLCAGVLATVLATGFVLLAASVLFVVGVFATPVAASKLMVTIPPATASLPLLKARIPLGLLPGPVQSRETVTVTVVIGPDGKVLNVLARTKNRSAAIFLQNTIKKWRFQPVLRAGVRVRATTTFTYPVLIYADRPPGASPARPPFSLPSPRR
jgi:hypothetical protein